MCDKSQKRERVRKKKRERERWIKREKGKERRVTETKMVLDREKANAREGDSK